MASALKLANKELRTGNFANAVGMYRRLLETQPIPRALIQFNLDYAERRAKQNGIDISATLRDDETSGWVTHKILQLDTRPPRIVIGGMVIGYPAEKSNQIPERVIEYVHLYQDVVQLEDIHGLRLLFNEELIKPSRTKRSTPFTVHAFSNQEICLGSIWYSNSRDLRVSIDKDPSFKNPRVLRAYQYEADVGGGLVLVGECLLDGESWQLTDLALVNPYLPVLLTLSEPNGVLADVALIPYPSLLPGGIHEHECYLTPGDNSPAAVASKYLQEHLNAINHGWALGQIQVDILNAIGTETIVSSDLTDWLWCIFSMRIKQFGLPKLSQELAEYWQEFFAAQSDLQTIEKRNQLANREKEGRVLLCAPRAIPSLQALTASRLSGDLELTCGISDFILVEEKSSAQRWRISWPETALDLEQSLAQDWGIHIPRVLLDSSKKHTQRPPRQSSGVSAILMGEGDIQNPLKLIMPVAPDFVEPMVPSTVDVIITAQGLSAEIFAGLIESLALQECAKIRQVVVVVPVSGGREIFDVPLTRYFSGRYLLVATQKGEKYKDRIQRATVGIARQPDDSHMLFINRPMILHDARTLAKLSKAIVLPYVATVSALLIGNEIKKSKSETVLRSGGIFPFIDQFAKKAEWRRENLATKIPGATIPVASHGDAIFMIKTRDWADSGGFFGVNAEDEFAAFEYSEKLSAGNKLHLLVSDVSVEMHDEPNGSTSSVALLEANLYPETPFNAVCIEVLES